MQTELTDLLTAYLRGWKTIRDCDEWLAGIDWDAPDLDRESRNMVGRLELIATEVAEGLREEEDFWQEAAALVRSAMGPLYVVQILPKGLKIADSSDDAVVRPPEFTVTSAGTSRSWSILPQSAPV